VVILFLKRWVFGLSFVAKLGCGSDVSCVVFLVLFWISFFFWWGCVPLGFF